MNLYQITVTVSGSQGPVMQMQRSLSLSSLTSVKRTLDHMQTDEQIIKALAKPQTLGALAKLVKLSMPAVKERLQMLGAKPVGKKPGTKQMLWAFESKA
jgi:predicted transcriptional regulator